MKPWLAIAVAVAFAANEPAFGQQRVQTRHIPGTPPLLERLDPTIGDVSPLDESLREVDMQADLRMPTGFQNVYRVPGRGDLLMRANGGMYAIFPQSVYQPTENGPAATVPPGTIFSIGMPSQWSMPSKWVSPPTVQQVMLGVGGLQLTGTTMIRRGMAAATVVETRRFERRGSFASIPEWDESGAPGLSDEIEGNAAAEQPRVRIVRATPPEPSTFLKTIVTDDVYRSARLTELLQRAAAASSVERASAAQP